MAVQSDYINTNEYQTVLNPVVRTFVNQSDSLDRDQLNSMSEFIQAIDLYSERTMEERLTRPFSGWPDRDDPFDIVMSWPVQAITDDELKEARESFEAFIKTGFVPDGHLSS